MQAVHVCTLEAMAARLSINLVMHTWHHLPAISTRQGCWLSAVDRPMASQSAMEPVGQQPRWWQWQVNGATCEW